MADAFKISRLSGNTESKWKKPWETSMTQEQAHLTGSLVTDRWFRPTGRHDVSATMQGVKPRGGRGAFKRHQLASSPFRHTHTHTQASKLIIQKPADDSFLPAHTCIAQLDLPEYKLIQSMQQGVQPLQVVEGMDTWIWMTLVWVPNINSAPTQLPHSLLSPGLTINN
ncbi:uncharacterized protein LOC135096893 [Scylla paramamosain]|uniref:uncharacterized protein LOC135096893 n=1 Tax=Scylla paramamosain TaxID=85552 RepID=UPI0030827FA8